MGVYDEYGYLGIQIKINATGECYKPGDRVPLPNGLVFGFEGVVLVIDGLLADVVPYDCMWDKWLGNIGLEVKAMIENNNPVRAAVLNALLDAREGPIPETFTVAGSPEKPEEESSVKPYWMVHRFGRQSGPANKVHTTFESAYAEAERLTRKEHDRFVILQAHTLIEPFKPLVITVETIGDPPAFIRCSEGTLPVCTCDPDAGEDCNLCGGLKGEHYTSPEQRGTGIIDDLECDEPNAPLPKTPCPCGCSNQFAVCTNPDCPGKLPDIVTPIPTDLNCACLACMTGVVPDLSTSRECTFCGHSE